MRSDFIRPGLGKSPQVVLGTYDVTYRAETVYDIDANLECLRGDHPDVDRLLDARRLVAAANTLFPASCSLHPELECPPGIFVGCLCSQDLADRPRIKGPQ